MHVCARVPSLCQALELAAPRVGQHGVAASHPSRAHRGRNCIHVVLGIGQVLASNLAELRGAVPSNVAPLLQAHHERELVEPDGELVQPTQWCR